MKLIELPSSTTLKPHPRKSGKKTQDKEFSKWLSSLTDPILTNSHATVQPSTTADNNGKTDSTKSLKSKEKNDNDDDEYKPKKKQETKPKTESSTTSNTPTELINSIALCTIPKSIASASSLTENIDNRNIVFSGMTTVVNRLKWNQCGNDMYTVDLDIPNRVENKTVDKVVQLMIESSKTTSFSADTKLTVVISWGELYLKIPQTISDTKPKNIRELTQLISQNNNIQFSFTENDVKTIMKERVSIHTYSLDKKNTIFI